MWHRYKPDPVRGWHENYICFIGESAKHFLDQSIFASSQQVINCGYRQEFIDSYQKIYDLVQEETPGYQQVCSGLVIKLLGYLVAYKKHQNFSGKHIEKVIQKIRFHIHDNVEEELDLVMLADEFQIGYSYFRKMFKKYTGVSPHQYQLGLKVLRARELILTTDKSIKEIGYQLGFSSIHYFSRFFKNKVGVSPTELKSVNRGTTEND
jgi:AraC-like DNA-binding protein